MTQPSLAAYSRLAIVETADQESVTDGVRCPDCGGDVSASKGGQPMPEDAPAERTFGWRCSDCHNVMPLRAFGPDAPGFNDSLQGVEVEFRAGHRRYIPVPTADGALQPRANAEDVLREGTNA